MAVELLAVAVLAALAKGLPLLLVSSSAAVKGVPAAVAAVGTQPA